VHLVQLLIPTLDTAGTPYPPAHFLAVRGELLAGFGGVTAFAQAPATGLWADAHGEVVRDEVMVYEVMTPGLDQAWWADYRRLLEARFRQDELVIRALPITRL